MLCRVMVPAPPCMTSMMRGGWARAMNGTNARRAAVFFIAVILSFPACAQGPDARWRTITTAHFRIHFPAEYESWAMRAASDIASVRSAVVREVAFAPEKVTDIPGINASDQSI